MDLHPQAAEDVKRILGAHRSCLSRFRGCLDLAVQEAGAYWEAPNPDFISIDPCTRTAHVRQFAAGQAGKWKAGEPTLRLRVVSFSGLHLYTPDGQRIRTRMRPRNTRTSLPMRAVSSSSSPLWGHDPSAQSYEVSVLLEIDLGTKTLKAAWLAAIDWGVNDKGREIYYEEEIPAPPMEELNDPGEGGTLIPPGSGSPPEDGFSDLLAEEEEGTGTDPA